MRGNTLGFLVLAVILFVGVCQIGYYYPKLPPTVASHFDFSGRANDWMPKEAFAEFHAIVLASLLATVLFLGFLIPRLPVALFNLPHKTYWLAPERSQQTYGWVFGLLLGCFNATGLLLTAIFELAYRVNLGRPDAMGWMPWVLLASYFGFLVVWLTSFHRRFARLPNGERSP
jgi:hypothetical protein